SSSPYSRSGVLRRRNRSQPFDLPHDRGSGRVDLRLCREATEAEPQRALCELVAAPKRAQDVRRRLGRGCARRTGRHCEIAERELQALAFDAMKAHVEHAAYTALGIAVQLDIAQLRDARPQAFAKRVNARDVRFTLALRKLEGEPHA